MVMMRIFWGCLIIYFGLAGLNAPALAQLPDTTEIRKKEEVSFPDPVNLQSNWWKFFEVDGPLLQERIDSVIDQLSKTQTKSSKFNNKSNQSLLEQLTINLTALSNLKNYGIPQKPETPILRGSYTLEEWLKFSNEVKKGETEEKIIQGEIARAGDTIKAENRSLDSLMAGYLQIKTMDLNRYSKGLEIMKNGSSLAVAKEKLRLAKANFEILQVQIKNWNVQAEAASQNLLASKKDLNRLEREIKDYTLKLEQSRKDLAKSQTAVSVHLGDSPTDKALARYKEQSMIQASVAEALSHVKLVIKNVEHSIFLLLTKKDLLIAKDIIEKVTEWENFVLGLEQKKSFWSEATTREKDLAQALLIAEPDKDANPELARINLDRSKLSGDTILSLQRLDNAVQDLKLLVGLLTRQLPAIDGDFKTWYLKSEQSIVNFFSKVSTWLTVSLFKINETPVTTIGLFRVLIILGLAWWLSGFVSRSLEKFIESRGEQDLSGVYTLSRLIHYGILGLGLFIALSSIGLDLSNLALVAGALSIGIGFGLQSIVNNFVSGLILLFERNIKIGNFIEIANGTTGVVKEINVRTTLINTNDNIDIILPNSELVGSSVINWTLREAVRRMHIPFGVAYGSDKDLVRKAVLEAADKISHTHKGKASREPQVWLVGFGDSSLNFELVVWINPEMVKKPATVHAEYMWEIETALHKYRIEIPFPQRDLHLKTGFQNLLKRERESS